MTVMVDSRGISLIEVIVATAILAIGLIGVLQAFPFGLNLTKSGQMSTAANYLAQAKIEQILANSYSEVSVGTITENYGQISDFTAYKRAAEINCLKASDLSIADCRYDIVNDPYPMKKIEVAVYWRSSFGVAEKNISLISLISKK